MPLNPPEFSVLLLAWDDADPTVAVLGGTALPPTLPLVYQLATKQPVLAVYPHLPAGKDVRKSAASGSPKTPAVLATAASGAAPATTVAADAVGVSTAIEAAAGALATAVNGPGVQVLPPLAPGTQTATPARQSRIIGLAELETADATEAAGAPASVAPTKTLVTPLLALQAAASHSQWPTGVHAPALGGQWQAPAAPYLGAGSGAVFPPPPPLPPRPLVAAGSASAGQTAAVPGFRPLNGIAPAAPISSPTIKPRQNPQAGDLNFDPGPELPAVQHPAAFQETTEEIGAGEAADISAPGDDLVPDAPTVAAEVPEAAPSAPVPAPATPAAP